MRQFPTHVDRHIGTQLRRIRDMRGMTQAQLGAALPQPLGADHITRIEDGRCVIYADDLWELAKALNVSPIYFYDGLPSHTVCSVMPRSDTLPKAPVGWVTRCRARRYHRDNRGAGAEI